MSLNARRHRPAPLLRSDAPKLPKVTREEAERLPLLDRVLLQEHQRHAARLADIRRVADKLAALEGIVRAAQADGAYIDVTNVRLSFTTYRAVGDAFGRRIVPVVLRPADPLLSDWRDPKKANAVANALLAAGWRVFFAQGEGSTYSPDRVVFMHGHRAVETTCMRQWLIDAVEAGHITAATPGRHPATDTGAPLAAGTTGDACPA